MIYSRLIPPSTTVTITFLNINLVDRMLVVGDGDGYLQIQSLVGEDWVTVSTLPPAYATHVNTTNSTLRFVTNGDISATIQVYTGEIVT
jgi:hypothetical protein